MGEKVKLACIDTGIGMTGPEMVEYINQLSSRRASRRTTRTSGSARRSRRSTRNHEGLLYLSWKDGVGSMIHLWRDPDTDSTGSGGRSARTGRSATGRRSHDDVKPEQIDEHGTMVVLLGNAADEDTMEPPEGAPQPERLDRPIPEHAATSGSPRASPCGRGRAGRSRERHGREPAPHVTGQRKYLEQHSHVRRATCRCHGRDGALVDPQGRAGADAELRLHRVERAHGGALPGRAVRDGDRRGRALPACSCSA